jgi:NAD(P)-dependent dehydrogenase (short-subunit alcohol dehydrogenase family)
MATTLGATTLGEESTTEDVLAGVDLSGKRVLVTGVSAGIGVETARTLVAHGAEVVGAARDLGKAEWATEPVREAGQRGGSFELVALDLGSLASVRACADKLLADGRPFDIVINNAGVMATPFGKTVDGFEIQFGTNHLGHFVLVNRILPLLREGSRVVSLSSSAHRSGDVDLDDPNFEKTPYNEWASYGRSKTANVLFAVEFDRRHRGRGIRACAVHPGHVGTELNRHVDPVALAAMVEGMKKAIVESGDKPPLQKSIPQGAATSVWAGVLASADAVGGRFCEDCHVAEINDEPDRMKNREGVLRYAVDPERAKALWAKSEEMVGERFDA